MTNTLWRAADTLRATVSVVVAPFRWIERGRRRQTEREERSHARMMELLDTVLHRAERSRQQELELLIQQAKSSQAHAEALQKWFELFHANMGEGATHTVRPADEADEADERWKAELRSKGYPVDASPEEQMAWLHNGQLTETPY